MVATDKALITSRNSNYVLCPINVYLFVGIGLGIHFFLVSIWLDEFRAEPCACVCVCVVASIERHICRCQSRRRMRMCAFWQNSKNSLIRWNIRRWRTAMQVCASNASNHVRMTVNIPCDWRQSFESLSSWEREMSICRKCSKYTCGAYLSVVIIAEDHANNGPQQQQPSRTRVRSLTGWHASWLLMCLWPLVATAIAWIRPNRLLHTKCVYSGERWLRRTRDNISFTISHTVYYECDEVRLCETTKWPICIHRTVSICYRFFSFSFSLSHTLWLFVYFSRSSAAAVAHNVVSAALPFSLSPPKPCLASNTHVWIRHSRIAVDHVRQCWLCIRNAHSLTHTRTHGRTTKSNTNEARKKMRREKCETKVFCERTNNKE